MALCLLSLALAKFLSVPVPGTTPDHQRHLGALGTSMQATVTVGAAWPSPSGRFAFGFYATDGGLPWARFFFQLFFKRFSQIRPWQYLKKNLTLAP